MTTALSVAGIQKAFGTNQVLHDVSFDLQAGQVTVLMGANGAGKSTLVKILSGVHKCDAGSIDVFGVPFEPQTPSQAMDSGVVTVHQNINEGVVNDLDIASNLLLEQLARGSYGFWLNKRRLHQQAKLIAELVGLSAPTDTLVSNLSLADRQLVSIARAMAYKPRILILDEPTSSLSANEANRLFTLIDSLREHSVAILYITHRMSDIRRLANRIVTMRDGRISGLFIDHPLDLSAAVNAMLGRIVKEASISASLSLKPVITLENIQLIPESKPFNLSINEGEVVAVTGLVGSGKTALANALFGQKAAVSGRMKIEQSAYQPRNPADAIALGVYLCPRDRGSNAIVPDFDLIRNISLPFMRHYSRWSWIQQRRELEHATRIIKDLGVVCQSANDNIEKLSGGNQQKVVVARWLSQPSRLLILDEPFQGVDIQARRDIGSRLRQTANKRATLVLVSELDEALEIADRIIVFADHNLVGEHLNKNINMELLLAQVASSGKLASFSTDSTTALHFIRSS